MVAGAAVAHHRSQQEMDQMQQQAAIDQQAAYEQGLAAAQAAAPPQVAAAPVPVDPMEAKMAALKQLGELHDSGILTDEEFAAQKQKVLDS
jgi:hypothetical protein